MDVRVVTHLDPETEDRWRALLAREGHLLQHPAWAALKAAFGWRPAWVLVEEGREMRGGAQVLLRPLPGGFTFAYVPRGPVLAAPDPEVWRAVLAGLDEVAHRQRAIFLRLEPDWVDAFDRRVLLEGAGFRPTPYTIQPRSTIHVDLTLPEEAILARMKAKWRYNIRLAARKGVTVREATADEVSIFIDLLQETARRDRFAIHTPRYYRLAWETLTAAGIGTLLLAWYEDVPLAGLFVGACGHTAIYLYGASGNRERRRMPNHRLQWEAMRWAKARGCTVYDLWGIPDEVGEAPEKWANRTPERTDGMWGVFRFKQGFGGRIVRYIGAWDRVYKPALYHLFHRTWGIWQRLRG